MLYLQIYREPYNYDFDSIREPYNYDFDSMRHIKNQSRLALESSKNLIVEMNNNNNNKGPYKPVRIAIIGAGVNRDHPFLLNSVKDRIDHEGDVVLKDLRLVKDASPCMHGTKVFSLYSQLFEDCSDMVKFVYLKGVNNMGQPSHESLNKAILRLLQDDTIMNDVKIVSISFGTQDKIKMINPQLRQNLEKLKLKKIVVAAASNVGTWNNDSVAFPARSVISIGSTDQFGERAAFTPKGQELDFLTLGTNLKVADENYNLQNEETFSYVASATSYSVPVAVYNIAHFLFQFPFHFPGKSNFYT